MDEPQGNIGANGGSEVKEIMTPAHPQWKAFMTLLLLRSFNCSHNRRRRTAHVFPGNNFPRYKVAAGVYVDNPEHF
jgi:hypothetical protein